MGITDENRCSCCSRLYSLGVECLVITGIIVHVIMSSAELLIHFDVIQVPSTAAPTVFMENVNNTPTPASSVETTETYDPGGDCNPEPEHKDLLLTVHILRYATLVLSALFLIEIVCKAMYLRKEFFKDPWQVFDMLVVLCSIGAEIAFFILHDKLLCFHPATEVATCVIILRLWRIPRACNIRKKEYRGKLEDELRYLTQTKMETELKYKRLEDLYQQQASQLDKMRSGMGAADVVDDRKIENNSVANVSHKTGLSGAVNQAFSNHANTKQDTNGIVNIKNKHNSDITSKDAHANNVQNSESNKTNHNDLERTDSDVHSKANDSGIEVKDSFRSEGESVTNGYQIVHGNQGYGKNDDVFYESDGSVTPIKSVQVEVQIEEISRQKQLPSITTSKSFEGEQDDSVILRRRGSESSVAYYVNPAFESTGELGVEDVDGTRTYRSAEGIPTTEL